MSSGRVFLRGMSSQEYGLTEFRQAQLAAPRVRGAAADLRIQGNTAGYTDGSDASWRLGPGDDPFLTQTIQVHFVEVPPHGSNKGHGHQNEAAFYILQGRGHEIHDGQRYDWSKGDLVYVHTDSVHRHFNDGDETAVALVMKAKSTWMYFGLVQQGRSGPIADEDAYGPRQDWSAVCTPGVGGRKKVVKPDDTAWADTPDGRVRVIASPEHTDQRVFSVDVFESEIAPSSRSGRRWQMADEVLYVLSGSGASLQWQVEAEIADRYYARVAKEPSRHQFTTGDTVYVPQNHVRQFVNTRDEPLRLLSVQNRLFRNLGYDNVAYLEHAPEHDAGQAATVAG